MKMEYFIKPNILGIEFVEQNTKKVIKIGMSSTEVESIIGKPDRDYFVKDYSFINIVNDVTRKLIDISRRSKRGIYSSSRGFLLGYIDDKLDNIDLMSPAKAILDGKNLLEMQPKALFSFMKKNQYTRVLTYASGDAFRGANIGVSFKDSSSTPQWISVFNLPNELSDYPEDEKLGLTLMNCPTRVKD